MSTPNTPSTPSTRSIGRPPMLAIAGTVLAGMLSVAGLLTGNPDLAWVAWIALFGAMEANAIRSETEGDTLSERLRVWFVTKTAAGRWGFTAALGVFALAFAAHITGQLWH